MPRAAILGLLLLALAPLTAHAWGNDPPNYDDRYWIYVTGYVCPPYCGDGAVGANAIGQTMACARWVVFDEFDIEGIGRRTCTDHYAAGLSDRFDVLVGSVAEAYAITGCHRYDIVSIHGFEGQKALVERYHVQDHHCDSYVAHSGPNPA